MVEVAALEGRAPCIEDADQPACGDVDGDVVFHDVAEAGASANGGSGKVAIVDDERTGCPDLDFASFGFELPG